MRTMHYMYNNSDDSDDKKSKKLRFIVSCDICYLSFILA